MSMSNWRPRLRFCYLLCLLLSVSGATAGIGQKHGHGQHAHHDSATVHHRFEDARAWAERFEDPARDAWQLPDKVVAALVDRDDLVIADIGSATGYFAVRFARTCRSRPTWSSSATPITTSTDASTISPD